MRRRARSLDGQEGTQGIWETEWHWPTCCDCDDEMQSLELRAGGRGTGQGRRGRMEDGVLESRTPGQCADVQRAA